MDKNLFKPLMTIGPEYGPDEKTIVKYRVEFIPQADGSVEIGDDTWDYKTKEYLTGGQGHYSREDAIKKWNELYNNPLFVIDNSTIVDESTNKYVKAFRESCRKLEEENAATKYFRGNDLHYTKYNSTDETIIEKFKYLCEDLSILQGKLQVLADISPEGKTNSQMMRIKKAVDAMYDLIPHYFGTNSPNFAAGDKDAIAYTLDKDGDWTASWLNK